MKNPYESHPCTLSQDNTSINIDIILFYTALLEKILIALQKILNDIFQFIIPMNWPKSTHMSNRTNDGSKLQKLHIHSFYFMKRCNISYMLKIVHESFM